MGMMCGGDGLADIVGRRFGRSNPLPWNKAKSWVGSLTVFVGGWATSMLFVEFFAALGFLEIQSQAYVCIVAAIVGFAATVAESLAGAIRGFDDNITVPLISFGLSALLL